jgi:hypothetical protein
MFFSNNIIILSSSNINNNNKNNINNNTSIGSIYAASTAFVCTLCNFSRFLVSSYFMCAKACCERLGFTLQMEVILLS